MADPVKTGLDVSIQYPFSSALAGEDDEALLDRIATAAQRAEPIRVRIRQRFGDRQQRVAVQSLHSPILHGRDAEGAHFAGCLLRDAFPAQRQGVVAATLQ